MNKAKILRLCKEIEDALSEAWNSDVIEYGLAGHIVSCAQKIAAEISEPPKSNGDRIRSFDDEILSEFLFEIGQCCSDAKCSECPIHDGCGEKACVIERWLGQEVSEDA